MHTFLKDFGDKTKFGNRPKISNKTFILVEFTSIKMANTTSVHALNKRTKDCVNLCN